MSWILPCFKKKPGRAQKVSTITAMPPSDKIASQNLKKTDQEGKLDEKEDTDESEGDNDRHHLWNLDSQVSRMAIQSLFDRVPGGMCCSSRPPTKF